MAPAACGDRAITEIGHSARKLFAYERGKKREEAGFHGSQTVMSEGVRAGVLEKNGLTLSRPFDMVAVVRSLLGDGQTLIVG